MKKTFSKDDIVEAAFRIFRKHGKKKLSARMIAKELNSSTMPIYSTISSMKEVEREVGRKVTELFLRYATTSRTGNLLIDSALGYIRFAKEEPEMFRNMFLTDEAEALTEYAEQKEAILRILIDRLRQEPELQGLQEPHIRNIMDNMEVVIHGLACLISFGRRTWGDEAEQIAYLERFSAFFIQQERAQ